MKVSLKKDSLAFQFGLRPLVQPRNMSHIPVADVVARINQFMKPGSTTALFDASKVIDYGYMGNPERDAVVFYMMNHAMSLVRQRKHPFESLDQYKPLVDEYFNMLSIRAMRMFFYLFMICTRESRHSPDAFSGPIWKEIVAKHGFEFRKFIQSMNGMSPSAATQYILDNPPQNLLLGDHVKGMVAVFNDGSWAKSHHVSFGGLKWGKIAEVLRDFVTGTITAEMMVDVAFTLQHNGGPIFNKSMMYEHYTPQITKVLDVQRSGQMPQWVAEGDGSSIPQLVAPEVKRVYELCHAVLGADFEGYVDWFKVEDLGAVGSYPMEQKLQVQKYGQPAKFKAAEEAKAAKAAAEAIKAKSMIPIFPESMSGPVVMVKKVERVYA